MKPTRRGFLKYLGMGFLTGSIFSNIPLRLSAKQSDYKDGIEIEKGYRVFNLETQKNMESLAETLIPWAKELEFRELFLDTMSRNTGKAGFFDAGLWNLNANSISKFKKPFYELQSLQERKEVIDHIISRNWPFYNEFRQTVIEIVYSNPQIWKKLSYNGPPQPRGFMDYVKAPKFT